jgi:hypothetical protein
MPTKCNLSERIAADDMSVQVTVWQVASQTVCINPLFPKDKCYMHSVN